ncbi:MAG TPA: hypothetical protein VIN57_01540 [Magnetovibrio sp.]
MNDTNTTYASQLKTLTTAYQAAIGIALSGSVTPLRSDDSTSLINATLGVLSDQALAIDLSHTVTKTDDVAFTSQVNCIKDILDTLNAMETKKAGTNGTLKTIAKGLNDAGETLAIGLDELTSEIHDAVIAGYSNQHAATAGARTVFQNSVNNYNAQVDDVLAQAKTTFRTADGKVALTSAITVLSETLALADQNPMTIDEGLVRALKASQQLVTLQSTFKTVQENDLKYIQSASVATLDQPVLKTYADMLKDIDAAFSTELSLLFGDTSVDPGEATELDNAVTAAASLNVPNIPVSSQTETSTN